MMSKVSKWNVKSAPAKGALQIQQLSEAAAILVPNKAELIGERKASMSTKGTIHDNNTEVMSLLSAKHDHVKEYVTKTEVPLEYLLLGVTFKKGKNKLKHIQRLWSHPRCWATEVKTEDDYPQILKGCHAENRSDLYVMSPGSWLKTDHQKWWEYSAYSSYKTTS